MRKENDFFHSPKMKVEDVAKAMSGDNFGNNVRTIAGIFRKIGKKDAIEFIEGIVSMADDVRNNGNPKEIERWLKERVFRNYPGAITLVHPKQEHDTDCIFDLVISEFQQQYDFK